MPAVPCRVLLPRPTRKGWVKAVPLGTFHQVIDHGQGHLAPQAVVVVMILQCQQDGLGQAGKLDAGR